MTRAPRHPRLLSAMVILAAIGGWLLMLSLNRTLATRPVPPLDDCLYLGQEWSDPIPYEIEMRGNPGKNALWDCGADGVIRVPLP